MGCGGVWQSDANTALGESMWCNPNTHSYSYSDANRQRNAYGNCYADADPHHNAHRYVYAHGDSYTDPDTDAYSKTYSNSKTQPGTKISSHPRPSAVGCCGER